MKYKAFKKFNTKNYDEIYTKEKETKAIKIEVDGTIILIEEQQFGSPIKPHITIFHENGSYSMNFSTLIEIVAKDFKR